MNTNSEAKNVQEKFRDLLKPDTYQEKIELDALLLAVPYLAMIQDKMEEMNMKKKDLAKDLNTSHSYITELMNINKMLNFTILARIAEVLDLKFQVRLKSEFSNVEYLEKFNPNKELLEHQKR